MLAFQAPSRGARSSRTSPPTIATAAFGLLIGLTARAASPAPAADAATKAPPAPPAAGKPAPRTPRGTQAPTAVPLNTLQNPGFEDGRDPWTTMGGRDYWGEFEIADYPVHSGRHSAHLVVHSDAAGADKQKVKVFGVVQEPRPDQFPDTLSGWYRVESYEKSDPAPSLYMQAVVIVWGDPKTGELVSPEAPDSTIKNYQIRYYLAGITDPPFTLKNARLEFVGKGPPAIGKWVRFDLPVKADFQRLWGHVPSGYEFVRVLFEGRWDNKAPGVTVRADVYYDDLYFGSGKAPDALKHGR